MGKQVVKLIVVVILSGKTFDVDIFCVRRKFFSSVNSNFSRSSKCTKNVKLHVCEAHCLRILLYAPECFDLTVTQKREINSWWNSVYRKIFGYPKCESVRQLIRLLERLDFLSLLEFIKFCFTKMLMGSESTAIKSMLYSYKLGKGCANLELKMSRAHMNMMKCKLYDKLCSILLLFQLIKYLIKYFYHFL